MQTEILSSDMVNARVGPKGSLEYLSQHEIAKLLDSGQGGLYPLFRQCALAVLNAGNPIDDSRLIFEKFRDFDLRIVRQAWGIKLEIKNAPADAFVDGVMIKGLQEHLYATSSKAAALTWPPRPTLPTQSFTSCAMHAFSTSSSGPTWWCAGAATRYPGTSTNTPRKSAMRSACAAWTCAPAVARER